MIFNELFVMVVEIFGQKFWFESEGWLEDFEFLEVECVVQGCFVDFVFEICSELVEVYVLVVFDEVLVFKEQVFECLVQCYEEMCGVWDFDGCYVGWFGCDFNNVYLVQVGSYYEYVDFFFCFFEEVGGFIEFYVVVEEFVRLLFEECCVVFDVID